MDQDRPLMVDEVADWRVSLTCRERQVLERVASGMGHREIASELDMSPLTVRSHQRSIRRKLGASTLANAVAIYLRAKALA